MVIEDLTWGGKHTIQYTNEVLQNRVPETYIILPTNVTPINLIKKKFKINKHLKSLDTIQNHIFI